MARYIRGIQALTSASTRRLKLSQFLQNKRRKSCTSTPLVRRALCVLGELVNWKRISIFSLVLFVVLVVGGIPFGYFLGMNDEWKDGPPLWFAYSQLAVSFFIGLMVFIALGRIQQSQLYVHALIVGLIVTFISTLIEVFLIGLFMLNTLFIDSFVLLLAIILGSMIGKSFNKGKPTEVNT